jgi:protein phosphatase
MMAVSGPAWVGAGATAVGGRAHNEDSFLVGGPVFVVSDGMGGHIGGAAASAAVVKAFESLVVRDAQDPIDVIAAVQAARDGVALEADRLGGDPGATLAGVIGVQVGGAPWFFAINVGDSRVYALDGGVLRQVSVDHSRVQEMVDAGEITPAEAAVHPEANVVTQAIGDEGSGTDAWLVPLVPGRRMVIASDGLMKEIDDARIAAIASQSASPSQAAIALVDAALSQGARDNVTVVIADALVATPARAESGPWSVWGVDVEIESDTVPSTRRVAND